MPFLKTSEPSVCDTFLNKNKYFILLVAIQLAEVGAESIFSENQAHEEVSGVFSPKQLQSLAANEIICL